MFIIPFSNIDKVVYLIGRLQGNTIVPLGTCFLTQKPGIFATCAHIVKGSDQNLGIVLQNNVSNGYQDTTNTENLQFLPVKINTIHKEGVHHTIQTQFKRNSNAIQTI